MRRKDEIFFILGLTYQRQMFNWNFGLACVLMVGFLLGLKNHERDNDIYF